MSVLLWYKHYRRKEQWKILESNGDSISTGFHIVLDESGNYTFDVDEGFTLNRFRADIYGEPLIDNLTKKQKNATADQMIEFMSGKEGFSGLYRQSRSV